MRDDDAAKYQAELAANREAHVESLRAKHGAHMPADIVPLDSSLTVAGHEPHPGPSTEETISALIDMAELLAEHINAVAAALVTLADKALPYIHWREESEIVAIRAAVDKLR